MSRTEVEPNVCENRQKSQPGKKPVLICPGFHAAKLTEQFVQSVFDPADRSLGNFYPVVADVFCADPFAVFDWIVQSLGLPEVVTNPLLAIGFSGGVVGLSGALLRWQQAGGQVKKLIAIDGWGMPIVGLPVCRLSHDGFTHWSTLPIGAGKVNFYANPSVEHLQMWADPARVVGQAMTGWQMQSGAQTNAAEFIRRVLLGGYE